jgi:DNA polymerase elongation subunit (family B)
MPSILQELLKARKSTRKLIPQQTDDFMKNVLDKRQLAYKVTANSLYGQCGAKTSTFYEKDIAASTTAIGRKLLTYAKRLIEEVYGDAVMDTMKYGKVRTKAEYVYGDTDSVFFTFNLEELDGTPIRGKKALELTIELAKKAGEMATKFLKKPHDLEYEKTFMPFCLLSKKRYVGMLYEEDPNNGNRKEMGIVLKRRDNAPIVKDIYGGIIDILMKEQDIKKAIDFLQSSIQNLVDEKYSMDKLIISKSIRSDYKNPQQIAHKVLADRITARDPGNKPASGDRIPYVYIHNPKKTALQGDKIETPTFIVENKIKIDYAFYITNQVMKPVQQVFALVLEKIWQMQGKSSKIARFKSDIKKLERDTDPAKFEDKLESLKNKEVKALLFDKYINKANIQKQGMRELSSFFGK